MQKISKINLFIKRYNWEGINYPIEKDDWKKNLKRLLLTLCMLKMKKKYPAYVSKDKSNLEKVIPLMISNGEGWHYIEVKRINVKT